MHNMATRNQKWALIITAYVAACCLLHADVVIDMTYVGNPGNPPDQPREPPYEPFYVGAVPYAYYIGTYEVTVAQYTEFLNSVAQSDPYGLYSPYMASGFAGPFITRSGTEGNYTYSAVDGKQDQPVRWVSLLDAMRFCNWMANGQGAGSTEYGSYDMSLGEDAVRSADATWVVPTLDEWYKAAYYSPMGVYYDYPNGTDDVPDEPSDETTPRVFNFGDTPFWQGTVVFTSTGQTTGQSPYGTFDQGGNVEEWTETFSSWDTRVLRGGYAFSPVGPLSAASFGNGASPIAEGEGVGFRIVFLIPEPSTLMLILLGLPVAFAAGVRQSHGVRRKR